MDEAGSKTKKHKRKHKYDIEKMEEAELCKTEKVIVEPNECISPVGEKKKKKKKKKKSKDEESEGDKIENEPDIVKAVCNKRKVSEIGNGHDEEKPEKKRKRKDQETERDLESQNNVSIDSKNASADIQDYTNIKSKKKKKSKKSKMVSEMDIEEGIIENADAVKQNEENNKHLPDIKNGKEKKKHKKKKKHMSESDELSEKGETNGSTDEILCQAVKKKKKKDKKKDKNVDMEHENTNSPNENLECSDKEELKAVDRLKSDSSQIQSKEKKTQEIDRGTPQDENVKTGQWSGVELGDSERQNKFYRLLGGFKKGSDASQIQNKFSLGKKPAFCSANNFQKKTGGNFAMDKKQENIYTKALEGEYERAMTMNLNRGIGLGFEKPPEEGKKFYIDTKSSKSVKFDD